MSQVKYEEGDACPLCGDKGELNYNEVTNCYCHISPPCHYCIEQPLVCNYCGEEFENAPD